MSRSISRFRDEYYFLSNFYRCSIRLDGNNFPTAEHAFQWRKATLLEDQTRILEASTPGKAKRIGRSILLPARWDAIKLAWMTRVLQAKFSLPALSDMLLATGDAHLIEGNNWHDNFWGACCCSTCSTRIGRNELGILLMKTRHKLNSHKSKLVCTLIEEETE